MLTLGGVVRRGGGGPLVLSVCCSSTGAVGVRAQSVPLRHAATSGLLRLPHMKAASAAAMATRNLPLACRGHTTVPEWVQSIFDNNIFLKEKTNDELSFKLKEKPNMESDVRSQRNVELDRCCSS